MKKNFSISKAIIHGFLASWKNMHVVFLFWTSFLAISVVCIWGGGLTGETNSTLSLFFSCSVLIFSLMVLFRALLALSLQTCEMKKIELFDFFKNLHPKYFVDSLKVGGSMLLYLFLLILGFLMLVVPSFQWFFKFFFCHQFVIEHARVLQAFYDSVCLTQDIKSKLFFFFVILLLLNLLLSLLFVPFIVFLQSFMGGKALLLIVPFCLWYLFAILFVGLSSKAYVFRSLQKMRLP